MSPGLRDLARPGLEALAARLGEAVVEAEGGLRAGPVGLDADGLAVGRLRLTWRAFERATAPERLDDLARVVVAFATGARKPLLATTWRRALHGHALPGGVDVRLDRGWVEVTESVTGWRAADRYETWEEPLARFDTRGLPPDDHDAGGVIAALARAVDALPAASDAPTEGTCRFCGDTFASRDFLFHEMACHGCAVSRLGVVF